MRDNITGIPEIGGKTICLIRGRDLVLSPLGRRRVREGVGLLSLWAYTNSS
jgi:hypothetical protein